VILTERDPEDWFPSTQATIFPNATPPDTDMPFDQFFRKVPQTNSTEDFRKFHESRKQK